MNFCRVKGHRPLESDVNSTVPPASEAKSVPKRCFASSERPLLPGHGLFERVATFNFPRPSVGYRIRVSVLSRNYEFSFWETESYPPQPLTYFRRNRHSFRLLVRIARPAAAMKIGEDVRR